VFVSHAKKRDELEGGGKYVNISWKEGRKKEKAQNKVRK
jgi:hypothetical protein